MKFGIVKPGRKSWEIDDLEIMFEHNAADCGDVFEFSGKRYAVGIVDPQADVAKITEIENRPDATVGDEENYEDDITCPFCGYKNEASFEVADSDDEYECGRCGAVMSYEREISVTYSAKLVSLPKIITIESEATP